MPELTIAKNSKLKTGESELPAVFGNRQFWQLLVPLFQQQRTDHV